ncbi:MAG TPA: hypothetical protein PLB02_04005 [Thermoanaerobaculia bacterium]|nr:hypothetical protein [Thermoanaerobaculia bacterium]HQR66536.1 hypothetical protein [Thermoanaerobaculia bacterium]
MSDARERRTPKPKARSRKAKEPADAVERDFGPGPVDEPPPADPAPPPSAPSGPLPGLACGGENCLLRPAADLVGKFALSLAGRAALGRAAGSGLELLKALRDFLDEEIALAERAAGKGPEAAPRYTKIDVE